MRPWSRTTSCWRCSCARHMRASLAESVRPFAHPKTVKEIASVSPIKRKFIKDDIALTSRQKPKTATALVWRLWCLMKDFVTCYYCLPSSQAEQDRELFRSILGKVCERIAVILRASGNKPLTSAHARRNSELYHLAGWMNPHAGQDGSASASARDPRGQLEQRPWPFATAIL